VWEFYALDTKLDLPATTSRDDLMKAMEGHVIGKAAYVGRFRCAESVRRNARAGASDVRPQRNGAQGALRCEGAGESAAGPASGPRLMPAPHEAPDN
jgi:hypothetical protein